MFCFGKVKKGRLLIAGVLLKRVNIFLLSSWRKARVLAFARYTFLTPHKFQLLKQVTDSCQQASRPVRAYMLVFR